MDFLAESHSLLRERKASVATPFYGKMEGNSWLKRVNGKSQRKNLSNNM